MKIAMVPVTIVVAGAQVCCWVALKLLLGRATAGCAWAAIVGCLGQLLLLLAMVSTAVAWAVSDCLCRVAATYALWLRSSLLDHKFHLVFLKTLVLNILELYFSSFLNPLCNTPNLIIILIYVLMLIFIILRSK